MTRNLLRRILLVLTWWMASAGSSAWAVDWWAESAPVETRAQATALRDAVDLDALARELHDGGITARVVRRLVEDEGWRYVLRIEGLADPEAGTLAARTIAGTGVDASVWMRDGDAVTEVERVEPEPPTGAPAAEGADPGLRPGVDPEPGSTWPSARQVLKQAEKAHGGRRDALDRVQEAPSLRFSYSRAVALEDGRLLVDNDYQRAGDALRLDVRVVEGQGVDSTTILTANNRAFVIVDGDATPRDPTRTREVLDRFGPAVVLAIPLGFTRDVRQAEAWRDLQVTGEVELASGPCWRLAPPARDPVEEGMVSACINQATGHLARVEWQNRSGRMRFDFEDYRMVADDLTVPFSIAIARDGEEIERIEVAELSLEASLDPDLFRVPGQEP